MDLEKPPIPEGNQSKHSSQIVPGKETHQHEDIDVTLGYKRTGKDTSSQSSSSEDTQKGPDLEYLTTTSFKDMIVKPENTVQIRPVLLGLSGLPNSGKTQAITHLVKQYVHKSPYLPPAVPAQTKGITAYYDILALGMEDHQFDLVEMNVEHSFSFGLLSAFRKQLEDNNDVLYFPQYPNNFRVRKPSFKDVVLENHLIHVYQHICQSTPYQFQKPEGVEESKMHEQEKKRREKLEALPKGTALVNVWNIDINKTSYLYLSSLFGHFKNSNTWLFLDIDRDLDDLDQPPSPHQVSQTDGTVATNWRPKLHYLLRASRLSQGGREHVCTIFAKHKDNEEADKELKKSIKKLEHKVNHASKQMDLSYLLKPKIKLINFNESPAPNVKASTLPAHKNVLVDDHTQRLYRKFYEMICETPYEEIPLSWVFLRSLYYVQKRTFISKTILKEQAKECGIDDEDFERFCRFHVSFGSIFDFTLINPAHKLIILAPIDFMLSLDKILIPAPELYEYYPMMKKGIVTETICQEIFESSCSDYMNSLISLELATKVTGFCQDDENLLAKTPPTDAIYYVPVMRKCCIVSEADPAAVYLVTSIDSAHINMQIELVKGLISSQREIKLVPCEEENQTILQLPHDRLTKTIINLVSFSPATKIEITTANDDVYASIVEVCRDILTKYREAGKVKYQFIMVCAKDADNVTPSSIPSLHCHILPYTSLSCDTCCEKGRFDDRFEAWNKALTENEIPDECEITDELTPHHIEFIVQRVIGSSHPDALILIIAKILKYPLSEPYLSGSKLLYLILLNWNEAYNKQNGSEKGSKRALMELLLEGTAILSEVDHCDTQIDKGVLEFICKDLSF